MKLVSTSIIFVASLIVFVFKVSANENLKNEMNGYRATQFGDFSKKWQLVTARYRKDTGEMRMTYANPQAWKVLVSGKNNYPDGAVFAKVSTSTKDDPAFPSSAVPYGARRLQFMVRNAKKHTATDGWGYALFDSQGKIYPDDPVIATNACVACHRLVPERGHVFSQPMDLSSFVMTKNTSSAFKGKQEGPPRIYFENVQRKDIPDHISKLLPSKYKELRLIQGELRHSIFSGTLDEVRPLLSIETAKTKLPAALISQDEKLFSIVFIDTDIKCPESEMGMKGLQSTMSLTQNVFRIEFCFQQ